MVAHDSSVHQKCSNYALTNLLFGLCRFVWVINLFIVLPNPHPKAPACLATLKVLRAKERALTPYPFVVFTFRFVVESTKEFTCASTNVKQTKRNEGSYFYLYPFGDLIQRSFQGGFYVCNEYKKNLKTFLIKSQLRVNWKLTKI